MRISDWSSDVCSSDLPNLKPFLRSGEHGIELRPAGERYRSDLALIRRIYDRVAVGVLPVTADTELQIGIGHHDLSPFPGRRRSLPMIPLARSKEHTSELQSLMRISYAVFCLKKKK